MSIKLASINLETKDPQASKRFYIGALGMKENPRRSHGESFVYLESAGADLTIATPEKERVAPIGAAELGFETDDLDAVRGSLEALATFPVEEKSMGWGRVVETRDFDGHRVIVYQFRKGGPEDP